MMFKDVQNMEIMKLKKVNYIVNVRKQEHPQPYVNYSSWNTHRM